MNYAEDRLDRRARHDGDGDGDGDDDGPSRSPLEKDLAEAHRVLRSSSSPSPGPRPGPLAVGRAHELAARALRDGGENARAAFHYAAAHALLADWTSAGDYAQMCDLAGFSELGVFVLLHHLHGGRASDADAFDADMQSAEDDVERSRDCGCGYKLCGKRSCHFAVASDDPMLRDIVQELAKLATLSARDKPSHDAASILEACSEKRRTRTGDHSPKDMSSRSESRVSPRLAFWATDAMPPLQKLLTLKLLYACPWGGPFRALACLATEHLARQFPLGSRVGRRLARDYKSHWAYYVLIRAVVLGERVKPHRRHTVVPYHCPVWDIVHGLDQRPNVPLDEHEIEKHDNAEDLSGHIWSILSQTTAPSPIKWLGAAHAHPPLYVLGDSHVLSLAWQTLEVAPRRWRTLVPYLATGLKAWHCREGTRFFTHDNLRTALRRLPARGRRTVLLSAGEIDCREGIGGARLRGYDGDGCEDAVRRTVRAYVAGVAALAEEFDVHRILLLPVAPHAYRSPKNGKAAGRERRRERTRLWNSTLEAECGAGGGGGRVAFLNYWRRLAAPDRDDFTLHRHYNADFTHMNAAFLPHLEAAIGAIDIDSNG